MFSYAAGERGGEEESRSLRLTLSEFLIFSDYPVADRALSTIVIDTYLEQALAIGRIGNQIALFVYLPDCFLCRAIILELKNKDGIGHIHHGVGPAYRTIFLHSHVGTHQVEDKVEDGLEIALALVAQTIGDAGKVGFQANHRPLNVCIIKLLQEIAHQTVVVQGYGRKVVGRKALEHAYLHLPVRIFQRITMQHRVVLFDGEVAALIEQRERRGHHFGRNVKVVHVT